jgi:hypothetical protein
MALQDLRLALMAFPQRWDGRLLHLHVLLLPTGNPLRPLIDPGPPFAGTQLYLQAGIIPRFQEFAFPQPNAPGQMFCPLYTPVPSQAQRLFHELPGSSKIVEPDEGPRQERLSGMRIMKALPPSYVNTFPFETPRHDNAVLGSEFRCSFQRKDFRTIELPKNETTWGALLSLALRQPLLAKALGLLYVVNFPLEDEDLALVQSGGWLYVTLDQGNPDTPYLDAWRDNPDLIKRYAAYLPPLGPDPRQLFAAVLFPVQNNHEPEYQQAFLEAFSYDDGFAKIVHCHQPSSADAAVGDVPRLAPATDAGIQIGWDDEQVVIWHNRQLDNARRRLKFIMYHGTPFPETPLGVLGYRVDVREAGTGQWHSLMRVRGRIPAGPLGGPWGQTYEAELPTEPVPVLSADRYDKEAWLPRYFAQWRGKSLAVDDPVVHGLTGGRFNPPTPTLVPLLPAGLQLRYGQTYEFRVRLADLSGGGPQERDKPLSEAPYSIGTCPFRRFLPPKTVRVQVEPERPEPFMMPDPLRKITVWRPLLGYPELTFTGVADEAVVSELMRRLPDAKRDKKALGVPDPDVQWLRIAVQVRAPAHDVGGPGEMDGPFRVVYEVVRAFPPLPAEVLAEEQPLELNLAYRDCHHINDLKDSDLQEHDPLPIPTARDVRLRLTPICHERPDYFANEAVREGLTVDLSTRREATHEDAFWTAHAAARQVDLQGIFLQPGSDMGQRLAQQLDLDVDPKGLTFSGKRGRRVVFGAAQSLRHTLSPERGVITFSSHTDFVNHWVVVLWLAIQRDWTWDGLKGSGPIVKRTMDNVTKTLGNIQVPHTLSAAAVDSVDGPEPDRRAVTHLVFFDTLDPNPGLNEFPRMLEPAYTVLPGLLGGSSTPSLDIRWQEHLRLPLAAPPTQVPEIASAGIALSPYQPSPDYSATEPRRRGLWLEFAEGPKDTNDTYFARVLAYGPDPLLAGLGELPAPDEPPLPLDPEPIRVILPGQPEDDAGLEAMQELVQAEDSDRHFFVPLPPGLTPESLELFGFWTYEIRVGHKVWSTAQARFGKPLRVTGVQHPAPALKCLVSSTYCEPDIGRESGTMIKVAAPFATPVLDGAKLDYVTIMKFERPRIIRRPKTRLNVLLYAQVLQADGRSHRNILLKYKAAEPLDDSMEYGASTRDIYGLATFYDREDFLLILNELALPMDSPLSVLAVEMLPTGSTEEPDDPLGRDLGTQRILRTSPLTPVPPICQT